MKFSYMLIWVLCISLVMLTAIVQADPLFCDGAEDDTLTDHWTDCAGTGSIGYSGVDFYEGANAIRLTSTGEVWSCIQKINSSWNTAVGYAYRIKFADACNGGCSLMLKAEDDTSTVFALAPDYYLADTDNYFYISTTGLANVRHNTYILDTNASHWYEFRAYRNGTQWDYYIDNQYVFNSSLDVPLQEFYWRLTGGAGQTTDLFIDNVHVWDANNNNDTCYSRVGDIPILPDTSPPLNSSWNVTRWVINGENTEAWNTAGTVNVTRNVLSLTVSSSENANMSCRVDVEQNYTTMINADPLYKATTTETTSHSMTVPDDFVLGDHCLYCSFIDSSNNEPTGANSSSGCLKFARSQINTSLRATGFEIDNLSFSSSTYNELAKITFNSSPALNKYLLWTAFNSEKVTGAGATNLWLKIDLDKSQIYESNIRTLGVGSVGSTGGVPLFFEAKTGNHNISFFFKRTGNGQIDITEFDTLFVDMSKSSTNNTLNYTNVTFKQSFVNTEYEVLNNILHVTNEYSPILVSSVMHTSNDANSVVSFYFNDTLDISPYIFRTHSGKATMSMSWVFDEQFGSTVQNTTLYGKTDGTQIDANMSYFALDMRDNESNYINYFSETNASNNDGTLILGAGTHVISSIEKNVPDCYGLAGSMSLSSLSGSQEIIMTMTDGAIVHTKRRVIEDGLMGNIFSFGWFDETGDRTYNLSVTLEGSANITDDSFMGFECVTLNASIGASPPIVGIITYPLNNTAVMLNDWTNWTGFSDNNDDIVGFNVSLLNLDNTYNVSINDTLPTSRDLLVNWSRFDYASYMLNVRAIDSGGLNVNTSVLIHHVPFIINISLLSPENNSDLTQALGIDFQYNVSNSSRCLLYINESLEGVQFASEGFNIFANVSNYNSSPLNNGTWVWKVVCDEFNSTRFMFNLSVSPFVPHSDFMELGVCPETTSGTLTLFLIVIIALFFILLGFLKDIGAIGFFGALMFMVCSWYVGSCVAMFGLIMALFSFVLIIWFAVSGLGFTNNTLR